MENSLQTAVKQKAIATHARIMANGQIVQNTLLEICKDLKAMRDERLYLELDYESFEDYSERALGIKQRQAYSYISTYEKLGPKYIEDNSSLGITKLELISQISSYEREEVLEDVDVESASVRELKATVDEYKKQTEQLSLELDSAYEELEKIKDEPTPEPDESKIEEAVQQARNESAELIQELKDKIKRANDNKKAAIEKAVAEATAAEQKKLDEIKAENDKLKEQNNSLDDKLAKAEQKAKVTGADPNIIKLKIYFDDFQNTLGTIAELLATVKQTDAETAIKLSDAIISFLQSTANKLEM